VLLLVLLAARLHEEGVRRHLAPRLVGVSFAHGGGLGDRAVGGRGARGSRQTHAPPPACRARAPDAGPHCPEPGPPPPPGPRSPSPVCQKDPRLPRRELPSKTCGNRGRGPPARPPALLPQPRPSPARTTNPARQLEPQEPRSPVLRKSAQGNGKNRLKNPREFLPAASFLKYRKPVGNDGDAASQGSGVNWFIANAILSLLFCRVLRATAT
jgi:hypothetical protein